MFRFNKFALIPAVVISFTGLATPFPADRLKLLAVADADAGAGQAAKNNRYGILGRMAPALNLSTWIGADGRAIDGIQLRDLRGKVVYLYFFQHWCPGCHSHGFPTLQALSETFKGDERVALLAVQTAFEGKSINTRDKLRKNQIAYNLAIPMGHDDGEGNQRGLPQTMIDYRSGGTPWTVIIKPGGKVVYNQFHIDVNQAIDLIKTLRKDIKSSATLRMDILDKMIANH